MLLDRMVQLETSCLRRLAQGREEIEIFALGDCCATRG